MFEEIAQKILDKVYSAYSCGSLNKGDAKTGIKLFHALWKKISVMLTNISNADKKKLLKYDNKRFNILVSKALERRWTISGDANFKLGDTVMYLPLDLMTDKNSKLLGMIKEIFPNQLNSWNEKSADSLSAFFADYYRQWVGIEKLHKKANGEINEAFISKLRTSPKFVAEAKFRNEFYIPAVEPVNVQDRQLFLKQTLKDVKEGIMFGVGQCGLMADLALLEAIYLDAPCKITYIRFVNDKNANVEESNAIVLGDWPNPGCLIVNPWHGARGKFYTWQGSIESTPEVKQLNNFNAVKVLFTVAAPVAQATELLNNQNASSQLTEERMVMKKDIIERGYATWSELPKRAENLALIKKYVDDFKESLITYGFIPPSETKKANLQLNK